MKIVFIIGVNNVGGAEYVSYQHVLMASRNDMDVTVLSGTKGIFFNLIQSAGIRIEVVGLSPKTSVIEPFLKNCDVVFNCNSFNSTQAIISLKQRFGFRYLTIIHSNIDWVYEQILKHDNNTDGYYAIHQKIVDSFVGKGKLKRSKFTVIPNCVDFGIVMKNPETRQDVRKLHGFSANDFVIGMITRIAPDKNILDAIKILKGLPDCIPAKLFIVGGHADNASSMDYEKRLLKDIKESGLTDRVVISGNVVSTDVYKLMQAFDLGLNCSPSEGLPIALLEMMGAEIPCIMPSFGEIPDVIDYSRGIVVGVRQRLVIDEILADPCYQDYEIRNFVTAISMLYANDSMRDMMGKNAAKYIQTHRSLEVQEKLFLSFIGSGQNARNEEIKADGTDVVYILGTGSSWANNEIRFSIRSFVKHFKDLRNIVIVGECPEFITGVIHIPCRDAKEVNKDARMMLKIKAACQDSRVSDNFILCTDDTLILRDLEAKDFTGWHDGPISYDAASDLKEHKRIDVSTLQQPVSEWFSYVYNTGLELKRRNLPDDSYDRAHCPQPINKAEFLEVMKGWNMIDNHYTISNIYNNSSKIFKGENIAGRNLKVYHPLNTSEIDQLASGKICMNYNDPGLNENMKQWLYARFPDATIHETFITDPDRRKTVQKWFETGCNYETGIQIFKHFAPKNRNLIRFFELKHNNENADKKLKYTLQLWLR